MTATPTTPCPKNDPSACVALEALRQPIRDFDAPRPCDLPLKSSMMQLAARLESLWADGDDDTLEATVVWSALYAFPALIAPGPPPKELVGLAIEGRLGDEEMVSTLRTLTRIRRMLADFDPPGFAAALWRETLLALFAMVELFVVLDDERGLGHCFELLDTAEAMADKFREAGT